MFVFLAFAFGSCFFVFCFCSVCLLIVFFFAAWFLDYDLHVCFVVCLLLGRLLSCFFLRLFFWAFVSWEFSSCPFGSYTLHSFLTV